MALFIEGSTTHHRHHHHHHHLRVVLTLLSFLWRNLSLDSYLPLMSVLGQLQSCPGGSQVPTEVISSSCFRSSPWS